MTDVDMQCMCILCMMINGYALLIVNAYLTDRRRRDTCIPTATAREVRR
jgi:hypothetical protein